MACWLMTMCRVYLILPSKTLARFLFMGRKYAGINKKLIIDIFYFRSKYNITDLLSIKNLSNILLNLARSHLIVFVSAPVTLSRLIIYLISKLFRKRVINYWIGTDVLLLNSYIGTFLKAIFNNDINITVSSWLASELLMHKVRVDAIYPIVPPDLLALLKIPIKDREKAILVYIPSVQRLNFYYGPLILKLAKLLPATKFYLVGISKEDLQKVFRRIPKNVEALGWRSRAELINLYQRVPILLRFTVHDGLPNMVLEALAFRLFVFTNVPIQDDALIYFPKIDIKNIASKIKMYLDNNTLINDKAPNLLRRKYDPRKVYQGLYNYLFSLCLRFHKK